jgi:hypothetical protein
MSGASSNHGSAAQIFLSSIFSEIFSRDEETLENKTRIYLNINARSPRFSRSSTGVVKRLKSVAENFCDPVEA